MQMMDCVEVIVEKESYAREGVHKGMQGWICYEQEVDGYWLVNFRNTVRKTILQRSTSRKRTLNIFLMA